MAAKKKKTTKRKVSASINFDSAIRHFARAGFGFGKLGTKLSAEHAEEMIDAGGRIAKRRKKKGGKK